MKYWSIFSIMQFCQNVNHNVCRSLLPPRDEMGNKGTFGTLLSLCGIIMIATAVVNIIAVIRLQKNLPGSDPNIIDAL